MGLLVTQDVNLASMFSPRPKASSNHNPTNNSTSVTDLETMPTRLFPENPSLRPSADTKKDINKLLVSKILLYRIMEET